MFKMLDQEILKLFKSDNIDSCTEKMSVIRLSAHEYLRAAAYFGATQWGKYLLEQGADPRAGFDQNGELQPGWHGKSALMCAAMQGQVAFVELLIAHAEKQGYKENLLNARNEEGNALLYAVVKGHSNVVDVLLSHNIAVYQKNEVDNNVFTWSIILENYWILSLLCAHAFSFEKEEVDAILVALSNEAHSGYSLHEINVLIAIKGLYERQGLDHRRSAKTPSWMSFSPYVPPTKRTEEKSVFRKLWGNAPQPSHTVNTIQMKRREM